MRPEWSPRASAAVVGALQGNGGWRGGGEAHRQRSALLAPYHRHTVRHIPMVLRSLHRQRLVLRKIRDKQDPPRIPDSK